MTNVKPPKLYVNGFPKAGLHLAIQMVACLFKPVKPKSNWFGTNAWTLVKFKLDQAVDSFSEIKSRHYLKGHTGYMPELDELFDALHLAMLFIYRDLRDVVVSQTYHILSDDEYLLHPGRDWYDHLNTKEGVMLECVVGNEAFPGIIDRWKSFEPWMDCSYVMPVRFEDMVKRPHKVAGEFFDWIYGLSLTQEGTYFDPNIRKKVVELMVGEMKKKGSTTFRRGKTGQWKREFTPEHVAAFKEADKDNALYKLGYTKKVDW